MDEENNTQINVEQKESIEITKNAKGEKQWKIKAVAQDGEDLTAVALRVSVVDNTLEEKYKTKIKE